MTIDQKKLLAVFEVRVHDLLAECEKRKGTIHELKQELASKVEELQRAMQTINELEAKCNSLRTARSLAIDENGKKSARTDLLKLVREVDKCIALLNE